jgi:predicted RNase H-like nuclease (RuvC/YqgF family)
MPEETPDVRLLELETQNRHLYQVAHDERRHLVALREEVRELQDKRTELESVCLDLQRENAMLRRRLSSAWVRVAVPVGGVVCATLVGRLFDRRRPPMTNH